MENFIGTITGLWENNSTAILGFGRRLLTAVVIIIGGKMLISISKRVAAGAVAGKLKFDETLASLLATVIRYAVIIICLIMILDSFGVNTTSLVAVIGAAGVAVGFALKDTLSNIAAGLMNIILRPFKKGDFIECGPVLAVVKEMGLFATILETPDGVFISAPNSSLWGVPLKNFSYNPKRRMDIPITISYTDSMDTAFQVFRNIIASEGRFLDTPQAQILVQSLGENGAGVTLRVWVPSDTYWAIYWDQIKNVREKLQEAGITIATPKREIRLIKDSKDENPFDKNLSDKNQTDKASAD